MQQHSKEEIVSTLYVESAELAVEARSLVVPIARRDQELAKRLKRAFDGVPEHIAEGMCSTGRTKRQEYGAALGSAREALACVRAAESVGYLPDDPRSITARVQKLLDRILLTMERGVA
jgi:four helix bundle protein